MLLNTKNIVRDEEAVGSNPAAPTKKDQYTFVYWSFFFAAGFERARATPQAGQSKAQWAFD